MTYQHLFFAVDDRVATITLNRPDRHNALSQRPPSTRRHVAGDDPSARAFTFY